MQAKHLFCMPPALSEWLCMYSTYIRSISVWELGANSSLVARSLVIHMYVPRVPRLVPTRLPRLVVLCMYNRLEEIT